MSNDIVLAGFGGQGILLMGQLLAYAGMIENRHVSWIPSYGPEMRGGTANCSVIIADEPVGSPIVTEPNLVVAMNLPSLDKFEPALQSGGILIINSSLIQKEATRSDITVYKVPANELAQELGNLKVANMIVLGAIVAASEAVKDESALQAFAKLFAKKPQLVEINKLALHKGAEYIKNQKK
jgi:2-oxoglutarate ferredoxin oxidoreductase subunit gamma